jgi:hypothetical protein
MDGATVTKSISPKGRRSNTWMSYRSLLFAGNHHRGTSPTDDTGRFRTVQKFHAEDRRVELPYSKKGPLEPMSYVYSHWRAAEADPRLSKSTMVDRSRRQQSAVRCLGVLGGPCILSCDCTMNCDKWDQNTGARFSSHSSSRKINHLLAGRQVKGRSLLAWPGYRVGHR